VADQLLNRVLIFSPIPTANGAQATGVLGQGNFTNAAANDTNQDGTMDASPSARTLANPRGVSIVGNRLLVADEGNHRVLVFESR
jgi:hypothetical protein